MTAICDHPQAGRPCDHVLHALRRFQTEFPPGRWAWHSHVHAAVHHSPQPFLDALVAFVHAQDWPVSKLHSGYCFAPGVVRAALDHARAAEGSHARDRCAACGDEHPHRRHAHYLDVAEQEGLEGALEHVQESFRGTPGEHSVLPWLIQWIREEVLTDWHTLLDEPAYDLSWREARRRVMQQDRDRGRLAWT